MKEKEQGSKPTSVPSAARVPLGCPSGSVLVTPLEERLSGWEVEVPGHMHPNAEMPEMGSGALTRPGMGREWQNVEVGCIPPSLPVICQQNMFPASVDLLGWEFASPHSSIPFHFFHPAPLSSVCNRHTILLPDLPCRVI